MPRPDYSFLQEIQDDARTADILDIPFEIDRVVRHNVNAKHLISFLARRNLSFKVVNLGAGVKRIFTTKDGVCPTCGQKVK